MSANEDIIPLSPNDFTYFEMVKMVVIRAKEIEENNSPPLIEIGDITDSKKIATLEFEAGVIPYILIRSVPSTNRDSNYKEEKRYALNNSSIFQTR